MSMVQFDVSGLTNKDFYPFPEKIVISKTIAEAAEEGEQGGAVAPKTKI